MAYCPECGLFYNEAASSCESCGHDLTNLSERDRVVTAETSEELTLEDVEIPREEISEPEVELKESETDLLESGEDVNPGVEVAAETVGDKVLETMVPNEAATEETNETNNDLTDAVSEIADEAVVQSTAESETVFSDPPGESGLELDQQLEVAGVDSELSELGLENADFESQASGFAESETFITPRESQLGKGIIKPSSVELSQDGIHFKYDEPPQNNFVKAEPFRERVTELRVSGEALSEGFGGQDLAEVSGADENEKIEAATEPVAAAPEVTRLTETERPTLESDPFTLKVTEDNLTQLGEATIPSPPVEPVAIKIPPKVEVLWEGYCTAKGINSGTHYCITSESVRINGPNQRWQQIPLTAIKMVKLKQSWWGSLVDKGSLQVSLVDQEQPVLLFSGIKQPQIVKKLLEDLILSKV